jgi:hypothetical protein
MSEVNQQATKQTGSGDDFVSHLHRMSTTAGVGAQEYVAISGASIAALVFGLASSMAILNIVLLAVPAVGVVCGIVAFRQIARSSGTLGGRSFAAAGLLLSLGFAAFVIVQSARAAAADAAARKALQLVVADWSEAIRSGKVDRAYQTVSEQMKQIAAPPEMFSQRIRALRQGFYGDFQGIELGKRLGFSMSESGFRQAEGVLELKYSKAEKPVTREVKFVKTNDGRWQVDDMPTVFAPLSGPTAGFRAVGDALRQRGTTAPAQ